MIPEKCTVMHAILPPSQIHYLRFLLEGYEGSAIMTTREAKLGLVELRIAPGCMQEVRQVLEAERAQLRMRYVRIESPTPAAQLWSAEDGACCSPGVNPDAI